MIASIKQKKNYTVSHKKHTKIIVLVISSTKLNQFNLTR